MRITTILRQQLGRLRIRHNPKWFRSEDVLSVLLEVVQDTRLIWVVLGVCIRYDYSLVRANLHHTTGSHLELRSPAKRLGAKVLHKP
jgi:hypothetical protein